MSDKERYPNNPLRNPTQKKLKKVFGDLPLVDAKERLAVFPTEDDFKQAVRLDPHNCGFARCVARTARSTAALVFAGTSFFDHPGKDGVRRIHRYMNSRGTKIVIREFDRGHDVDISKAFVFLPPSQSKRLSDQKKKGKRTRANSRGKVIIAEWMARKKLLQAEGDLDRMQSRLNRLSEQQSPQAPAVKETKQQISMIREKLPTLRDDFQEKTKKASAVRLRPFVTKKTKAELHALNIRNGTGFKVQANHP
jgi:hypothetical protein